MDVPVLLALLAAFTLVSGILVFLSRRLLHSVIFLALAAAGSSLLFIYVSQTLVALLQLLVFVGSLCTYLIVAVAMETRKIKGMEIARFVSAAVVIAAFLSYLVYGVAGDQASGNSFSYAAAYALSGYSAFLFAAALMLFATAMGSIIMMKRLSKMVF
jgi:NADH:ubiquinone oxidoreductase subunit 6 (subunit J)